MSTDGFEIPAGCDQACLEMLKEGTAVLGGIATALHETIITGYDPDGNYLFNWMPPELEKRYGLRTADLRGKNLRDLFPPEVAAERIAHCRRIFETGQSLREEYRLQLPNGTYWHDITLAPLRAPGGQVVALVAFIRDITERVRAERWLSESEERYRAVVEQIADAIIIHRDGLILFANRTACESLGFEDPAQILGKSVLDFTHPDSRQAIAARLASIAKGETRLECCEERFVTTDGRVLDGEIRSQAISFDGQPAQLAVIRNVTEQHLIKQEREQMQARMLQSQKLESLGLLASGVAHDFNNLLLGVLGNAGLALADLPAEDPARDHLEKIETATIRASELTRQLLTYAGSEQPALKPVDLERLIVEMTGLLSASLPGGTQLVQEFGADLPRAWADGAQLRQVVMNLILNAAEAQGPDGGRIRIGVSVRQLEDDQPGEPILQDRPARGSYLALEVTDSGCGMDPDTRKRIFDPFFTTKRDGRGLGLAAVLGIIRTHRGFIRVDSAPGRGSTFEVLLPVAPS